MTQPKPKTPKITFGQSVVELLAFADHIPPLQRSEFNEAVRRVSVLSKVDFRRMQRNGEFTDGLGDIYLECEVLSLDVPGEVLDGR